MPVIQNVIVSGPVCQEAVERYVAELREAGFAVAPPSCPAADVGDAATSADRTDGLPVRIAWACPRDDERDAGEWEDDEGDGFDVDGWVVERAAEHYARSIRALARRPEIASEYLARTRRKRRRRARSDDTA